jgi:hypothetical protein
MPVLKDKCDDVSPVTGGVAYNIISGGTPRGDAFGATFGATKLGDALVPRGFSRPSTYERALCTSRPDFPM